MEPTKTDPRQAQALADKVGAAKLSQATRIMDDLVKTEEKLIHTLDVSEKLDKRNKELDLQMSVKMERHEQLTVALADAEQEFKFAKEAAELAERQAKEWEETHRRHMETEPKRPWSWKRLAWAGVSCIIGVGTALLLRKRAPIINAAAGGCATGNLMGKIPGCKNHAMIGSAAGALGTHWAHQQDNLVGISVETVLAGVGYAELAFNVGEAGAEKAAEAYKAMKENYAKTKKEIEGGAH